MPSTTWLAAAIAAHLAVGLAAGPLTHLLLDSPTPSGIAWLFPLWFSVGFSPGVHSYAGDAILLALSGLVVLAARMGRS